MSYSFTVRGSGKADALALVEAELAKIADKQPVHGIDKAQALAVAEAYISMLPGNEIMDVQVAMYGSLAWIGFDPLPGAITASSVSVTASLVVRG